MRKKILVKNVYRKVTVLFCAGILWAAQPACVQGSVVSSEMGQEVESVQLEFARLQLEMAAMAKNGVSGYMNEIQRIQEQQKQMASLRDSLEAFKKALSPANNKLPDNIKKELYQSGIATESILNQIMDVGRVNFLIDGVNQRMDELGAECQKKMVMVQDFMGQYNSYAQGSNAAIQSGNQQLQGIARGGTMLDGDKGMLFTGFLTGALVGVLGVLAGQRTGKKK